MSRLSNLPEDISIIIWKNVFQYCLDELKYNNICENMCDCCMGGYDEPNEFGLCHCCCQECFGDCRYTCEFIQDDNTCDCCMRGYDEPNEIGLCQCWCEKCYQEASVCRYTCEYYTEQKL